MSLLRGLRDGFTHYEHEHGPTYEAGAALGEAFGRIIDRALHWS